MSVSVRSLPRAVLVALFVVGCSGDARPLEEAIEVERLGLESLSIRPPLGTIRPLTVNADERIPFTLRGRDDTGTEFEIDGSSRRWSVSDSNVATIDENGSFLARADGEVEVGVRIGEIAAGAYVVTVSTSSVASIERIENPENDDGQTSLDPCVSERFVAVGIFADGSERLLPNPDWESVTSGARLVEEEDGSALFSAAFPGTAQLSAASNQASLVQDIPVDSTLQEIVVGTGNDSRVGTGREIDLSATGRYGAEADGNLRDEIITATVDWEVTGGLDSATVSNEAESRGRFSGGDSAGTATVSARCGETIGTGEITVFENTDGTEDDVRFEGADDNDVLEVAAGSTIQLRFLVGNRDFTEEVRWRALDVDDRELAFLVRSGEDAGLFTAGVLSGGNSVVVNALYGGVEYPLTIDII